jgi:hypothetical protein
MTSIWETQTRWRAEDLVNGLRPYPVQSLATTPVNDEIYDLTVHLAWWDMELMRLAYIREKIYGRRAL